MLLRGKYCEAVIHTDFVENEAISQIINILNQPMMEGVKVRIMPDVHAGAGICIGYTATLNDYVVPNFIGVDIGCGLTGLPLGKLTSDQINFQGLDDHIRKTIPSGTSVHQKVLTDRIHGVFDGAKIINDHFLDFSEFCNFLVDTCKEIGIDYGRVLAAIGSLGGGNHFISIDRGAEGDCYLVVHSGSRNFGKCVAEYYQKKAAKGQKSTGLEYLEGINKDRYLAWMEFAQMYAALNQRVIIDLIGDFFSVSRDDNMLIESVHNYISFKDKIIRKGAISANDGEMIMIPLSMADGILYCQGKGNSEWNCSAPHGAGRLMSRSKAKQSISLDDYRRRMEEAGVWSSCVGTETLDESPQAYKDPEMISEAVGDTAEIIDHWKEIYNFKAA